MTNTCSPDYKTLQERMRGCRVTMESGQLEMARPTQSIHRFFWNFHLTRCTSHICQMKHFYVQQCEHWSKYFFPGATVQHFSPYHKSENSDRSVILDAGPILVALVTNLMQVSGPGWHHHQVGNDTKHRATMVSPPSCPPTQPSTIFINGSSKWLSSIRSICTLSRF